MSMEKKNHAAKTVDKEGDDMKEAALLERAGRTHGRLLLQSGGRKVCASFSLLVDRRYMDKGGGRSQGHD